MHKHNCTIRLTLEVVALLLSESLRHFLKLGGERGDHVAGHQPREPPGATGALLDVLHLMMALTDCLREIIVPLNTIDVYLLSN